MVSKSVETRDWIGGAEPRNVRSVMKRVIEELSAIDVRVAQLYEEGLKKERSSDSSRRTAGLHSISSRQTAQKSAQNWLTVPNVENPLLKKLWTDKIDYFASVEFTKVSILTGIIKVCLKTLLECVRLKTFGKFGLQQVQVDCHYLQTYLWRFVSDENLVQHLLEEVISSAVLRCIDPVLMEPSVVEAICERS